MQQQENIQKITTNLWFDRNAAEAVDHYMGIFKNARKGRATFYGKEGVEFHGMPEGSLLTQEFELEGRTFIALNGGPQFTFSEAISFIINCNTQEEIDHYWDKLAEGGTIQMCGWLKDKFGVSWQVVPVAFTEMLLDPDTAKVQRVMQQMFKMQKLDIAPLQKAFDGAA